MNSEVGRRKAEKKKVGSWEGEKVGKWEVWRAGIRKYDPPPSQKGGTMPRQACGRRKKEDRIRNWFGWKTKGAPL